MEERCPLGGGVGEEVVLAQESDGGVRTKNENNTQPPIFFASFFPDPYL